MTIALAVHLSEGVKTILCKVYTVCVCVLALALVFCLYFAWPIALWRRLVSGRIVRRAGVFCAPRRRCFVCLPNLCHDDDVEASSRPTGATKGAPLSACVEQPWQILGHYAAAQVHFGCEAICVSMSCMMRHRHEMFYICFVSVR